MFDVRLRCTLKNKLRHVPPRRARDADIRNRNLFESIARRGARGSPLPRRSAGLALGLRVEKSVLASACHALVAPRHTAVWRSARIASATHGADLACWARNALHGAVDKVARSLSRENDIRSGRWCLARCAIYTRRDQRGRWVLVLARCALLTAALCRARLIPSILTGGALRGGT